MADHAKPILTDNYTDVLSQIRGRFEDQAKGFDPANTTATNISTGTIRWNSAEKKFQKWSGTTWGDLTDNYVLSGATFSTGTANGVMYLNGSRVVTTGSALTFDGKNLSVTGTNTGTGGGAFAAVLNGSAYVLALGNRSAILGGSYDATPTVYYQSNSLAFFDANAGVEQMRLTSTGLGIGTSSPVCKLDVQAPANGLLANFMENTSGATRRIRFSNNGTTNTIESTTGTGSTNLAFAVDGTERMRLDTSGNLGIGVTPSAWGSNYKAVQIFGSSISRNDAVDARLNIGNNFYFDSSNQPRYILSAGATYYRQGFTVPDHAWFIAPSGTAGNPISFTQAMTLDANGKLILSAANQGIQFADGTTQTTAAILRNAVGEVGTYALLRYNGTGAVSAGMVVSSDSNRLGWSSAAGHTGLSYVPPGQLWRCMGEARDTNDAIRTTLFLRLS